MKILVSGSTGLVGSTLVPLLAARAHQVTRLVRRPSATGDAVAWDPRAGTIDTARLTGVDGVVHLAGESIAGGRWTPARKQEIRASRVLGTRLLSEALARLERPPRVLVSASAIGFYGDRGDQVLTEASASGDGFLADVCVEWEAATQPARDKGIRVVNLRLGIVLSRHGGALKKMLLPFKLGVGGKIGSGRQFMSWIAIDDVAQAIRHALETDSLSGPVNAVATEPVTNLEFTRTLGRVLNRPTLLPMPAAAARLALGEMADELLLASARVTPTKLLASNYPFAYTGLAEALRHVLGK